MNSSEIAEWKEKKKKESGADERRWMDGYVRKRDRWGATEQVESTIEPSVSPSLYNDILHCEINKSMGNTCSAPLMMEILARHYFAASARIDKNRDLNLIFSPPRHQRS